MAGTSVTYNLGPAIQVIGDLTDAAAYRAAQNVRGRVLSNIRRSGRIDTGRMIAQTQVRRVSRGDALVRTYDVASTARAADGFNYPDAQENGTRAHGPKTAARMVFVPKGGGGKVFATWVRGVTPGHFFRDAYASCTVTDFLP